MNSYQINHIINKDDSTENLKLSNLLYVTVTGVLNIFLYRKIL